MRRAASTCWLCATLLWIFPSGASLADGSISSFGPEKQVSVADFRPHLSDAEWYKEVWNFNAWTRDGRYIAVDFIISNIGFGDHKGVFRAKLNEPGGKKTRCKAELDSDEWSWSRKGFALDFGKARVQGDLDGLDVTVRCEKLEMDLRFDNLAPSYKPGGGKLKFGQEGYYFKVYPSARSRVTGTVVRAGEKLAIDAPGMVEHSASTVAPHKQARRWFRFKKVDEDFTIMLSELQASPEYAGSTRGWAMVYGREGKIIATARVRFDFDGFIRHEKSEHGYRIPRRVRLAAVDGNTHLTGTLVMTALNGFKDPTADLNAIIRTLVRRFSKPMDYRIGCSYDLRIKNESIDRRITGDGVYRFIYVNP